MQEGFVNYNNANNFDPNSLANQTATAILFVVITDVSPSINSYVNAMNTASREVFMQELKNCHRKNDILIKNITFASSVKHTSGFLPIVNLQDDYLDVHPRETSTSLYQAVLEGLEHAFAYRKDLEAQGIEVRTAIFIITDGVDNDSPIGADKKVATLVDSLRSNEAWISSFTINMLGVGSPSGFRNSCIQMGLDPDKCLVTISNSASEIRQQMGVVSQSVSGSSAMASSNF